MDLREIIKWFIPCFHLLIMKFNKIDVRLTFLCLFLFFNCCPTFGAKVSNMRDLSFNKNSIVHTKNVDLLKNELPNINISQNDVNEKRFIEDVGKNVADSSVGRTFGRPFKKMIAGLIPLVFQIGAASTWAVIAAIVGVKTLFVTLVILKLLLVAGAAKAGALFASKTHQKQGWEHLPQKEIHLHIHNGGHGVPPAVHDEHVSSWSRKEIQPSPVYSSVINPYSAGPQTISTPYGNYVKIE